MVLVVLLGSALASGTEAALFSAPMVRIRALVEDGSRRAKMLFDIKENLGRPIAGVVILNNVFNIVGSIVIGGTAAQALDSTWLGVFSGVLTFLVIVVSEIIPKTIGERHSLTISLAVAAPVKVLTVVLMPVIWFIERLTGPLDKGELGSQGIREQEIKILAKDSHQAGGISRWEADLVQKVFHLKEQTANDIMTPRVSMTSLDGERTLEDAITDVMDSVHSRMIVVGESQDDVIGVVLRHELLTALATGASQSRVKDHAREVHTVPQSVSAQELLSSFRARREHLHVVRDEYGGVAGIVTLEDVLEELTGEILDETDKVADLQEKARRDQQSKRNGVG
jgi:CBS domain containing-hemolysin-like protein